MDLRDIQRLHAQFSEPFTIDLPARIAALPAPEKITRTAPDTGRRKWPSLKPAFWRSGIALAAAALVAAAGVGSASLYKSWHADKLTSTAPAASADAGAATAPKAIDTRSPAAIREIDASPSQPVAMTPPTDAGSRGTPMPQGLSAEQFRQAVTSRAPETTRSAVPAISSDEQRAINSPIRRPTTTRTADVKPVRSAVPEDVDRSHAPQPAVAPVAVNPVTSSSIAKASLPPHAAPTPATAQPTASPADTPAATAKPVRQPIHHAVKSRAAPSEPSAPAPEKSPSPPAHAGSNEVQMF